MKTWLFYALLAFFITIRDIYLLILSNDMIIFSIWL